MLHIERSMAIVRGYLKLMDWPKSKLAEKAGVSETVTRAIDRPTWSPSCDSLRKLEAAIPADLRDSAERAGTAP